MTTIEAVLLAAVVAVSIGANSILAYAMYLEHKEGKNQ